MKLNDLSGKRFGRLEVKKQAERHWRLRNRTTWHCLCDCGQWKLVTSDKLLSGNTQSCGCLAQEMRGKSRITHGETRGDRKNWGPRTKMFYAAKARAKKVGVPFTITIDDIIVPETCPVFGFPLLKNSDTCQYNSPSLDRFIPKLGYVKGNVYVISHKANTIKSDATLEELEKILAYRQALESK